MSQTKPTVSGMSATEVRCMNHASVVPRARRAEKADPPERSAQIVWMIGHRGAPLADGVAYAPDDDGQRKTADQGRPRHLFAQGRVQAVAGVPDDMANAADQVMKQRPGETEQDQPADERLENSEKAANVAASAEAAMRNQASSRTPT